MVRYNPPDGTISENGWPMIPANHCAIVEVVPAAKKVPLRRGSVATILNAFLILYDREVEPITSQVWGWSDDNDVYSSNHMSGTAVDIGAPKYPWGKRTMPADRVAKVRRLLAKFEGTVFWGRDWSYPDEMHFQIGLPPSNPKIKQFADRLNNGHLGAYSNPQKQGDSNMLTQKQFDYLREIKGQLTGSLDAWKYPGWPQLGDRTVVDALAVIGEKLNIEGFYDPKAKKTNEKK